MEDWEKVRDDLVKLVEDPRTDLAIVQDVWVAATKVMIEHGEYTDMVEEIEMANLAGVLASKIRRGWSEYADEQDRLETHSTGIIWSKAT
jgi:hypothetical protein